MEILIAILNEEGNSIAERKTSLWEVAEQNLQSLKEQYERGDLDLEIKEEVGDKYQNLKPSDDIYNQEVEDSEGNEELLPMDRI